MEHTVVKMAKFLSGTVRTVVRLEAAFLSGTVVRLEAIFLSGTVGAFVGYSFENGHTPVRKGENMSRNGKTFPEHFVVGSYNGITTQWIFLTVFSFPNS